MTNRSSVTTGLATLGDGGWDITPAAAQRSATRKPVLSLTADHPYSQWWGTNGRNGLAAMFRARGIVPSLAINTDDSNAPGSANMMTWGQLKQLTDGGYIEPVGHGAWHVDKWSRINTGIRVEYIGTNAAATVQVNTAVPSVSMVCTSAAPSADSVTSTFSTDTTLAAVKATIEANGKWRVTLDPILTGLEASTNLLGMNAARNILAATTPDPTYFCAGGGLELRYFATNPPAVYEHVWARRNSSANFSVFGDGVLIYNHAGSTGSLSTLGANVRAIAGSEFHALLCDAGAYADDGTTTTGKPTYMIGDELETNLHEVNYLEFGSRPAIMECGLSQSYIINRHMERVKTVAAANGITIRHFAQSGGNFYDWMATSQAPGMQRGNPLYRTTTPFPVVREKLQNFIPHRALTNDETGQTYYGENILAIPAALCGYGDPETIEPWVVCLLMHVLKADGTSGYAITSLGSGYFDQYEADWVRFLDAVKTNVDAGLMLTKTLGELADLDRGELPANLWFNPGLENGGASRVPGAGVQDGGFWIPGHLVVRAATVSSLTVSGGVMTWINSSATATEIISQDVQCEPGRMYEVSCAIDPIARTSGAGLQWSVQALHGNVKDLTQPGTNWKFTGAQKFQAGRLSMQFAVPPLRGWAAPKVRAQTAPATFDLSVNKNIKINVLSVGTTADIDCSGGTPAATTAKEIAAKINAAIVADANYATKVEYHNIATVVNGYLTITAPYIGTDQASSVSVTAGSSASAVAAIFGNATVDGRAQFMGPQTSEQWTMRIALRAAYQGTIAVSNFNLREVGKI